MEIWSGSEQKKHLSKEYYQKVKAGVVVRELEGFMMLNFFFKKEGSNDKKFQQHILCVKIVMSPKSQSLTLKIRRMIEKKTLLPKY